MIDLDGIAKSLDHIGKIPHGVQGLKKIDILK